jgi:hypothetical protein
MPGPKGGPRQSDDQRNLEWVHIDDFTPGVYDNSFISLAEPKLSAPLGSADAIATFCCAAIGANGLGPLPALTQTGVYPTGLPGSSSVAYVTGFQVNPGLNAVEDELILIFESDDGTHHYVEGYSVIPPSTLNTILSTTNPTTSGGIFGAPYPSWTRMNLGYAVASCTTTAGSDTVTTASNFVAAGVVVGSLVSGPGIPDGTVVLEVVSTTVIVISQLAILSGTVTLIFVNSGTNPSPILVFPGSVSTDGAGVSGHLYIYPPILAPTTFAVQDLIVSHSSVTGQVICYGSRVICLVGQTYPWPAGGGINTNENINFTDPPQSSSYGDQATILTVETPWGYGAWGTMSVGELMLIKKYGGAIIMYGDVDNPSSVIWMPGVESVGDFVGKAASTVMGLIYCSEQRGAWIWNGGNTSQKISGQLRDSFYDATSGSGLLSNNYGFCVSSWQDWILFSNNYMYNSDTGSWWVLYPAEANGTGSVPGHTMWWWIPGRFGNTMYSAPIRFGTAVGLNRNWFYKFDDEVPAPHWQWQSLPIHVDANADRVLDVRQVIVRLSDPSNSGNATATVTINGTALGTTAAIGLEPTAFRFNVGTGARGIHDIIVLINGDNAVSGSSPILHSIDVGYEVRAGVPVSN